MPYITKLDKAILEKSPPKTPGELNYLITKMLINYLNQTDKKYKDYNEIVGVVECVKQEFYRRAVSIYEDEKIKSNGDVFR